MSGAIRLSVCAPGATAAELIQLARHADYWNLGGLWIGDPHGRAPNSDDNYVTAAAAAVAAVTVDLRIGLILGLREEKQVVRLAEDAAVLDQASRGRLELALRLEGDLWLDRAARFLRAWDTWELPGRDETVAVMPGPAQPTIPRLIIGDEASSDALEVGRMLLKTESAPERLLPRRRILILPEPLSRGSALGQLRGDPDGPIARLRDSAQSSSARDLLFFVAPDLDAEDFRALGTVYVPSLRASERNFHAIARDSHTWLIRKKELHAPPS
jgi:hypothetical protein